ncbi:GNAT family N-acetyltransferase [Kribbella turkmenica]|uniref:GNAT family N-acetyltransferase n=1 Tax=Kribbella turkmenica TaxID=2530375 RepID=UPI0014055922|nr:GNAT family N-acetyltransferase [Kribbella turkmenica]
MPATLEHIDLFAELNCDPDVMRYVTGRSSSRAEVEEEWSRRFGPRTDESRGLGYWVGYSDARFIGWWGLGVPTGQLDAGELGFRIKSEHWRRGFGFEGARCVIDHGFSTVGVRLIWAGTVASNAASRATLTKLGLRCIDEPAPGVLTYAITLQAWRAAMH